MNVGFTAVTYEVEESSGSVPVCIEVSSPHLAEREFFLMVTSNDRDAGKFSGQHAMNHSKPRGTAKKIFAVPNAKACSIMLLLD